MSVARSVSALILLVAVLSGCGAPVDETIGRIAFQASASSPTQIMTMNGDGTSPQTIISDGHDTSIRWDGRLICFIMQNDIYTIRSTGTGLFKVTDFGPGLEIREATVTKSGTRIAYVREVIGPTSMPEIHFVNSDGTDDILFLTDGEQPAWNMDATQLAFVRGRDVWVVNSDGTGLLDLTNNGLGVRSKQPAFSPSNVQIAFVEEFTIAHPTPIIRILDLISNETTTLVENGSEPSYRPDGGRIAFVRGGDIYSVEWDGADIVQLTSGPSIDAHPSWGNLPQ